MLASGKRKEELFERSLNKIREKRKERRKELLKKLYEED